MEAIRNNSRGRRRSHLRAEINMVPFIDVLLVILVLVLVTSGAAVNYSDLELPTVEAASSASDTKSERISIRIDKDGRIFLNDAPIKDRVDLIKSLEARTSAEKRGEVEILGDKETSYQQISEVLSATTEAGYKKLRLAYVGK